ncbi:DUF2383 domain-containing protein [Fulvivirga sp. M361]|uniref:DUF2383 domain-containing protein n=1 Tax=Fulvivirga sp. M361 TaxID=2594266 RepID=UPI00162630F3|nr:DUF2383 domain-containing protein [Fulvivirga sp. M361]
MNEEVMDALHSILKQTNNATRDYHKAAEAVGSLSLKIFLEDQIVQRSEFMSTLARQIEDSGIRSIHEGKVHSTWMDMNTAISLGSEAAIIRECIRGEKAARDEYEKLLKCDLSETGDAKKLLTDQLIRGRQVINRLEVMQTIK